MGVTEILRFALNDRKEEIMGLRYRIPFKDSENNSYEVQIFRADYSGEVTELTGATSCFVVSGTDEDFVYTPVRTSSATINVLDSDLLLDLYSINNQYAAVRLLRNGVLEWTGYIKPEQFTQPYVPYAQSVSVECVCALATLEHMEYKELNTLYGTTTLWNLMKYLISSAKGGYNAVYMPWVYGTSGSVSGNVFERITLIENNFIKEEMNLMEVLEAVCKFLGWTVHDVKGSLWFVDADWNRTYRRYDEALSSYTEVSGNEVLLQDIGFNGSGSNTLDVIPGYNKASVKAINNVFDDVVKDEPYDILKELSTVLVDTYASKEGAYGVRKQFLKPMLWKVFGYQANGMASVDLLTQEVVDGMANWQLNEMLGAVLMREAVYKCKAENDSTPADEVTDFNYEDSVQIRIASESTAQLPAYMTFTKAITMEGENAVYADCAISIDGTFEAFFDKEMAGPVGKTSKLTRTISAEVSCGGKWFNGTAWVDAYTTFTIEVDEMGKIKSNRTPFTPYKNISGFVIPMDFFVGEPVITIFCPIWLDENGSRYITGVKVRGLKFGYAKKEGIVEEGADGDRVYENVVNEAYMSDADEISFEISSYNADGASFSKALLDNGWLTNNLYCAVVGENVRPEELMIRRIVNRYGETKIKLTEAIRMTDDVTPLSVMSDRAMVGKRFRLTSGEWDYEQNRLVVQMQEDVD